MNEFALIIVGVMVFSSIVVWWAGKDKKELINKWEKEAESLSQQISEKVSNFGDDDELVYWDYEYQILSARLQTINDFLFDLRA